MSQWVYNYLPNVPHRGEYVFSDNNGRPLKGATISHKFKRYIRKAKLNDTIHLHSMRHASISFLANKGVPQETIRRLAGHSSVFTTEIYTLIEDSTLIAAVNHFPLLNEHDDVVKAS